MSRKYNHFRLVVTSNSKPKLFLSNDTFITLKEDGYLKIYEGLKRKETSGTINIKNACKLILGSNLTTTDKKEYLSAVLYSAVLELSGDTGVTSTHLTPFVDELKPYVGLSKTDKIPGLEVVSFLTETLKARLDLNEGKYLGDNIYEIDNRYYCDVSQTFKAWVEKSPLPSEDINKALIIILIRKGKAMSNYAWL